MISLFVSKIFDAIKRSEVWACPVLDMKVVNELRHMSKLVSQQPRHFFVCTFISGPMDKVQEFAMPVSTVDLQVEDLFNLVLSFTINVDQRWWSLYMIGDCVRCCRF